MSKASDPPQRPASDDRTGWKAYWVTQRQPWRTEPEVDEERQVYLAKRRAIRADIGQGIYPFRDEHGGISLTRADVEWLLATHDGGYGPVRWEVEKDKANDDQRWGLDLRGAVLREIDLLGLPLVGLRGGLTLREWITATPAQRAHATVDLSGADLRFTLLEGANLRAARLQHANLFSAQLAGASLNSAHLEGGDCRRVSFDDKTDLSEVQLGSDGPRRWPVIWRQQARAAALGDILWGDVDLTRVRWATIHRLGDEQQARLRKDGTGKRKDRATRLDELEVAVRANRQVATRLRDQGMSDDADQFAYRARVCQRSVYLRQARFLRYFGSLVLALIAGYGYRPLRSILTYVFVVLTFAFVYFHLGGAGGRPLAWNEALVVSLTAFYGPGFFATAFQPGDPQAAVAAGEAVIGLLIEITFIATFTQRFFAR